MGKKIKSPAARRRLWHLLHLALLWARKGDAFKRLFIELRLLPSYLKNLRHGNAANRLRYCEREFSFEDTPAFHLKFNRLARIPCIAPSVSFDDDEEIFVERSKALRLWAAGAGEEDEHHDDELDAGSSSSMSDLEAVEDGREEGDGEIEIDSRAECFIMKFYEQMKLQRQISYLEYNDMLHRGMSS
ncbi:uncharacterized protein LOC110037214 [Phalaenopsis equestris]|uniref:uncharacterized protein LOC110037214 n=1 Tax=Phalaenopsis equestris TaxID=78828 RepID=UPI0009E41CB4|nr:uncharacterized protein LOC110037214 [Phalaenopsis equestris]